MWIKCWFAQLDEKRKSDNTSHQKKDNKCFQCAVTVALNYEEIKEDLQRITKIKLFIDRHIWEGINYLSKKDHWKKAEKNNLTIALKEATKL